MRRALQLRLAFAFALRMAKTAFRNQLGAGPQTGFLVAARTPKPIAAFAPALIAAKSLKPCDRGIFGALNPLLKMKRNVPGAAAASGIRFHACGWSCSSFPASIQGQTVNRIGLLLVTPGLRFHAFGWVATAFRNRFGAAANQFCQPPRAIGNHRWSRSCFDSSKAPETVRWRHFRGLESALKNEAECARHGGCARFAFSAARTDAEQVLDAPI